MQQRTVGLPEGVVPTRTTTTRGELATWVARPRGDVRGSYLLVPGFTGSKEDFGPLLPLLADAGWLAVALDQRGQLDSRAGPGADLTLEGLAADVQALAEALEAPRPRRLLGHSLGGLVAQAAAVRDPSAWDHLTLLCSGPGGFTEADEPAMRRDLPRLRELLAEQPIEVVHEIRQRHALEQGDPQPPPPVADFLRRRFLASSPVALSTHAGHLLEAPDVVDRVAATGVPTTVVRGADDDAWSHARQDEMAARLGTTVVVVEDAAHSPAVENPTALAAVLTR
jgi:pimeloyl-ACP methyl ester carboxylesterase